MKSSSWVLLPITILLLSLVILYPNFAERELELHISPSVASLAEAEKKALLDRFQEKWKSEYNTQNSLTVEPDPALGIPTENYFLVKGRFITSAKINQISQENINLFIESKNKLRPTKVESFLKNGKSMTIKLGLDLQGGMRVVMKGDFEDYVSKLRDIYSKQNLERSSN